MIKIHKEVYGQGPAIVLIHGWAMHTGIWRSFAQQLAMHYQVICLDLPGHGLSEAVSPYTLENISEALIKSFPESPCTVLGWSLGASVALTMAKQFPRRVNRVIFLSGNPKFVADPGWPGMQLKLLQAFAENLSLNCQLTLIRFLALQVNSMQNGKALLRELKIAVQSCPPPDEEVLQSALDILKNSDLRQDLIQLTVPVSIVQGDKDTLIPVSVAESIQKIKPQCQVSIISGAGHLPFLSHQSKVIDIIKHFV